MNINKKSVKEFIVKWWPLLAILLFISVSFVWGWFLDNSKPVGGVGWSDQTKYIGAAERMASGMLPTAFQMHYSIGYPLLGVVGNLITGDPFAAISFTLLVSSAIFCYLAFTKVIGKWWGAAGTLLLFIWDWGARSLNFSIELFLIPWNNQLMFFAFAFFFWLLTNKMGKPPSYKLVTLASFVVGITFMAREESLLFLGPMMLAWLLMNKAGWKKVVLSLLLIPIIYTPQVLVKQQVLGSFVDSGRGSRLSYPQIVGKYFHTELFVSSVSSVIVGDDVTEQRGLGRDSLFQAAPWLWLSLFGIVIVLALRRYTWPVKIFVIISLALLIFYLSGDNIAAKKLPFHCLRYISPSFIMLNFASVLILKESYDLLSRKLNERYKISFKVTKRPRR